MATTGTGIIPSGAIASELTSVVRRAFLPGLVVQLYKSTPLLSALLGNARFASGGVSSLTQPVQGASMVDWQWTGYTGSFAQPQVTPGVQNAELNLTAGVVPIPFYTMEGLVEVGMNEISLIEARMGDAMNVARDALATAIYTNITDTSQIIGLPAAIDDGTNAVTYAGISRTTYPFWKSKYTAAGSVAPTRNLMNQYINSATLYSGGEMPDFAVMGFGTWTSLADDFASLERYNVGGAASSYNTGPAKALFRALEVAGVPAYADPYMTEGEVYFINSKYLSLYLHSGANFAMVPFESMLANAQLGYVGAILVLSQLMCTKPKACAHVTGLTYTAL